ncbi:MAG: MarR family transcriptional regulator [Actinomycetota bacterium]
MLDLLAPPEEVPTLPADRPLDEVFKTRSHVRVLRVLALVAERVNLSARDVARRAEISAPRAMVVLRELERAGVIMAARSPGVAIWRLDEECRLTSVVRAAFERERALSSDLTGA